MTKAIQPVVVVDASAAIKLVVQEPDSDIVATLTRSHVVAAPELLLVECANALWKRSKRGEISGEEATRSLTELRPSPISWTHDADLVTEAQAISLDLKHPIYDCLYLALARRLGARLITADRRLAALGNGVLGDAQVLTPPR